MVGQAKPATRMPELLGEKLEQVGVAPVPLAAAPAVSGVVVSAPLTSSSDSVLAVVPPAHTTVMVAALPLAAMMPVAKLLALAARHHCACDVPTPPSAVHDWPGTAAQ